MGNTLFQKKGLKGIVQKCKSVRNVRMEPDPRFEIIGPFVPMTIASFIVFYLIQYTTSQLKCH